MTTDKLQDGVFCPSPRKGIFQDSPRGAIRPKERTPSAMICQSAKTGVEIGLEQGDERGSTVNTDVPKGTLFDTVRFLCFIRGASASLAFRSCSIIRFSKGLRTFDT